MVFGCCYELLVFVLCKIFRKCCEGFWWMVFLVVNVEKFVKDNVMELLLKFFLLFLYLIGRRGCVVNIGKVRFY